MEEQRPNQNIYKISRSIKRRDSSLYNALRSIHEDSIFVGEIAQLWPDLPLLANLRCGLWYSPNFHSTCYFKSTDGHTNNLSFSTARLNLHVALLAAQRGGCIIVDATRKGKRFPDSMTKTIPIWTCVLNRAIHNYKRRLESLHTCDCSHNVGGPAGKPVNSDKRSYDWDGSLHLPLWVSETEKEMINKQLEGWNTELEASGADIASIALTLRKPLRPLWISQKTVIWLNEVPEYDSWDFTPVILVSGSSLSGSIQQRTISEFSWNYIAGAGDDEESWARGLSPGLFWKHANDIISSGPDLCNQKVANIVEKDRVCRTQRGENAPQLCVKPSKCAGSTGQLLVRESIQLDNEMMVEGKKSSYNDRISFLGTTNIAVCKSQLATEVPAACCILNCDKESFSVSPNNFDMYLYLPILDSKLDRFSLLRNLPSALNFAQSQLRLGNALLICCCNGEDISVCICLAVFTSFFDEAGNFDDGISFGERRITKVELRRRLVFICKYIVNARPSRGNLKQVFACLSGERIPPRYVNQKPTPII